MFETITLDQLRFFLSVSKHGSFSEAGRKLHRVQSAVSQGIANLEKNLGIVLFDRTTRKPTLTDAGRALLIDAEQVFAKVAELRTKAASLSDGQESEVAVVVDAIVPAQLLVKLAISFQAKFPTVTLRIHNEVMSSVLKLILDDRCQIGIGGSAGETKALRRRSIGDVVLVSVASPDHCLASEPSPIPTSTLKGHTQIVVSEHQKTSGPDHGVLSLRTWRVAEISTKRELIIAGLGWGSLPLESVEEDLESGRLVVLSLQEWGSRPYNVPLYSIVRDGAVLGPASQWLLSYLDTLSPAQ